MTETQVTIQDVAFGGSGVGRLSDGKPLRQAQDLSRAESRGEPPRRIRQAHHPVPSGIEGRAESRGKVVFVPRTLTGETVSIRLSKSRKGFVEAELVEVIKPSPHRVTPPCPYFERCGGCAYQHATYEEQIQVKEKQLRDTLIRIGGLKELPSLHVETAAQPFGYRNKIVVHRDEEGRLGFFATDGRSIVDIEKCLIANDPVNEQLAAFRKNPQRGPRHVTLSDPDQREEVPRGSFYQTNTPMAQRLLEWVRKQIPSAEEGSPGFLLDLYCGAGFFTLGLADCFSEICGVDRDAHAIHTATARAQKTGVAHARFFAADIEERIDWILESQSAERVTLLVDPPREGLPRRVTEGLLKVGRVARLIYVSCNPATLARDLKLFMNASGQTVFTGKFGLYKLALFDMFPQTTHIETVAILERTH